MSFSDLLDDATNLRDKMSRGNQLIDDLINQLLINLYHPPYTPSGPVLVDENEVVRISELIYRLPDQDLKSLYNNPDAQHISVDKWMNESKNGERRWIRFVYGLCVVYSILHFLIFVFMRDQVLAGPGWFRAISYLFHALIVFVALIFVVIHREPASLEMGNSNIDFGLAKARVKQSLNRASLAVKQCLQYWPILWCLWLLLYLFLSAYFFVVSIAPSKLEFSLWAFPIIFNMLNNGTALVFFIMYYELSERTLDDDQPKGVWLILSALVVLIMFVEFVLTLPNLDTPDLLKQIQQAFSILSGVLTGVATSLLTVRFASRIMEVPPLAIILLVLYAIIQPLFPLLFTEGNPTLIIVGYLAVNIALYSKITLLVIIHWIRNTHQLSYYMVRALQILEEEGRNRLVFVNEFSPQSQKLNPQMPISGSVNEPQSTLKPSQ